LALVGFYIVLYPLERVRVVAWSDIPTYVWWARRAGSLGLAAANTGSRPALVAVMASLGPISRSPVAAIAEVVGPVFAASVGLAAAAVTEFALGHDRLRFVLAAALTGTFVSLLVTSFLATLAFGALFVAGLACLLAGLVKRTIVPCIASAVLIAVAGLAHPIFLIPGIVFLAGGMAIVLRTSANGEGPSVRRITMRRVAGTAVIAVVLFAIALAFTRAAPGSALDTSRDAFLRRSGLNALITQSYRITLFAYLPWLGSSIGAAAIFLLLARRSGQRDPSGVNPVRGFFWGVMATWIIVTVAGVALLAFGLGVPGQRLAAFCVPLPLMTAIGMTGFRQAAPLARPVKSALIAVFVGLLLPVYWLAWHSQVANSPAAVSQARIAASTLAAKQVGTPLILVADNRTERPALEVTRFASYLRDAVPPARLQDVYVFVGTIEDFLARRPTLTGLREHDLIAQDYWGRMAPHIHGPALAVALRALDPTAYRAGLALSGHRSLGSGVVALPGFVGGSRPLHASASRGGAFTDVGPGPLSPWLPVWLGPLVLAALAVAGWAWADAALPHSGRWVKAALSPALGLGALAIASIAVDGVGLRLSSAGGPVSGLLALLGGLGVRTFCARRFRRAAGADVGPSYVVDRA
jgi:hypothetical protein